MATIFPIYIDDSITYKNILTKLDDAINNVKGQKLSTSDDGLLIERTYKIPNQGKIITYVSKGATKIITYIGEESKESRVSLEMIDFDEQSDYFKQTEESIKSYLKN